MLPVLSKINPTLSFFFISDFFFNFFFFYLQSNLKPYFEFLWTFSFFKVSTFLKTLFFGKIDLRSKASRLLINKTYKHKIYKKSSNLKLKSFFFLKNIKKMEKLSCIDKKFKNKVTFFPLYFFNSLRFFKKNMISFVGLPFFKNYDKFYSVRRVHFPKHLSKSSKKIKLWKFKKILKSLKKNTRNKRFYYFAKKIAYIFFADSNNFFFKSKKNHIKMKNLTYNYVRHDNFFFLSPIKYFFLKRKSFFHAFKNFKRINRKSKKMKNKKNNFFYLKNKKELKLKELKLKELKFEILDIKNRKIRRSKIENLKIENLKFKKLKFKTLSPRNLRLKEGFRQFNLKFKTAFDKLKKKFKQIKLKKNKKNKKLKTTFKKLVFKFKSKFKTISRKTNSLRYRIRKKWRKEKKKSKNYAYRDIYWSDYRLSKLSYKTISQFSPYTALKPVSFNLNYQKLKNFYKNDFLFNNIQTSSNFFLNYYKFFFFQQNKLKKKKKRRFYLNRKKIKFRRKKMKMKIKVKMKKRRKKLLFLKKKKKKLFFLKKNLRLSYYKKYNFLRKKKFFFFKDNFLNFNRKFSKFYLSKFNKIKKNNFFFSNSKKNSFWSLLLNNNLNSKKNTQIIKNTQKNKNIRKLKLKNIKKRKKIIKKVLENRFILLKKKTPKLQYRLKQIKKLKNKLKYNFKLRRDFKKKYKRVNKYGRRWFIKIRAKLSTKVIISKKIFKVNRSSFKNNIAHKRFSNLYFKKWKFINRFGHRKTMRRVEFKIKKYWKKGRKLNYNKKYLNIRDVSRKYLTKKYLTRKYLTRKYLTKKYFNKKYFNKNFINKKIFNKKFFNKKFFNKKFRFKKYSKKKKLKLFFFKFILRSKTYKKKSLIKKKKNFFFKSFFFLNNSSNSFDFFKNNVNFFKNVFFIRRLNNLNLLKKKNNLKLLKDVLFFENKKINFFVFNLKSKIKSLFVLNSNGFLYLSGLDSFRHLKKESAWVIRKTIYSFASKNDLQNFILKKYIKNKHFAIKNSKYSKNPLLFDLEPHEFKLKYINWGLNMKSKHEERNLFSFNGSLFNDVFTSYYDLSLPNIYDSLYTLNPSTLGWTDQLLEPFYLKSLNSKNFGFSIKKTRFKPGYSTMWRNFRTTLKATLDLKFRYQKKLTKYLIKFNKIIKNRLYFLFEMQLENILALTRFFPDRAWTVFFINEGYVFVNNRVILNIHEQLFKNDFIQLSVSLKYYIIYRWLMNWHIVKKNKLRRRLNSKINAKNLPDDKQKSRNLPIWLLKNKNLKEDVSRYLEVDYISLSCFVLYEPLFLTDINPLTFLSTRFSIINLFNWKYIN